MTLRERILAQPLVFRAFKGMMQSEATRARLAADHLRLPAGARVLDVGCGYGDWARYFPHARYLGIDHNAGYIDMARRQNGQAEAEFVVADVADPFVADRGPFDLVLVSGVLHHLDDDHVGRLLSTVVPVVAPDGRFVAFEPVFDPDQPLTARLTIAADRGRYVRDEAGYRRVIGPWFGELRTSIVGGVLRVPYTYVVAEASVPLGGGPAAGS